MQELKAFNEQRAEIYWWLSSLFVKELSEEDIARYQSVEIRTFLSGLGNNEQLKTAIDAMIDALNRLQDRSDAQLELAADFCDLFLKTAKDGALPYASIYATESGLLNGQPAREMETYLSEFGVEVTRELNEPADHLSIELDLLGNMIIRSNELEQERHMEEAFSQQFDFINHVLLTWLPKFNQACQATDRFGFYAAASALLLAFCYLDRDYLANENGQAS
ncbi:molecular chaperone TorD [Vibrio sp. SM6]|uniref:Chaperone protein TorD n=1 Tax=Vibrio agarilyticus TaxID=2726741 RepID=A0A7X8TMH3_9VIBR|nr:molecular chaperone TorD [Vibrio agarilyticus]NLS11299.1 molecular chaperone TorD [Vibrio agarilyticus]